MGNDSNARWGVLWLWENKINQVLTRFGEVFDKLICIRKVGDAYSGYFTMKDLQCTFCQVNILFIKGRPVIKKLFFWSTAADLYHIHSLTSSELIFDKRDEFTSLVERQSLLGPPSETWD
jgi:hypothetical protein